ncbi:prospero homeobox protein 1-like protein [Lates japonicus]|uniref:Prospero homeobox protein 1-like protein n=1 Tax=Lates japonicus TaxID=270547 RepID=A0AAD3NPA9_LATJO|nr:prospero homeobox protein 1-like protein [Lates japonicus]
MRATVFSLLGSQVRRAVSSALLGVLQENNKRKQRLPATTQAPSWCVVPGRKQRQKRRQLKLQLEDMQKRLRQLQEKFYQIYDSETEEEEENGESGEVDRGGEREEDGNLSEDSIRSDGLEERHRDRGRHSHDELSELDPGQFLDRARALLREQALLDGEIEEDVHGREEEERNGERVMKRRGRAAGGAGGGGRQFAETLKQELNCAVSQVVDTVVKGFSYAQAGQPPGVTRGWSRLPSRSQGPPSVLPRFHGHDPGNCQPPNQNGIPREGHLSHHRQSSPSQHRPEGLSLSLIKSECGDLQDIADISPYSGSTIQEGLSPNHLKKAKLMFFYTRYPSSNMLKMYFSDVKFNRCITSQLIKWFSNFREFYYIQMEKFARQAINEGVTAAEELTVGRDAELFRALNMHYNKANDFEVPDRFLEVAQVTLREFFNAIVAGKDADPSWKKAIYKVICKLDSEVPEVFKSPNCLQELLHD